MKRNIIDKALAEAENHGKLPVCASNSKLRGWKNEVRS